MNVSNIKYFCTTNGDGFRTAVFVSGCNLHCKGCFNKAAWDFTVGKHLNDDMVNKILDSIEPEYIEGLSILGGEPMDPKNQGGVNKLITAFRHRFGCDKSIWLWTGYTYENIPKTGFTEYIMNEIDYLVDGPFQEDKSDINLRYRGSSNQHIIPMSHKDKLNKGVH